MPWWGWVLVAMAAIALLGVGALVFMAKLFEEGDNPSDN